MAVSCTGRTGADWVFTSMLPWNRSTAIPYHGRARLTEFLEDPELIALFNGLDLATGDRVEIVVRLRRPTNYRNPGVFDFQRYLERQGIFWTGTIRNPRLITVLDRGHALWRVTDRLRAAIERRLSHRFEDNRQVQGLVLGIVLGLKHDLTASVERDFQAGGLYHMVVVSGFNLAVVGAGALFLSRLLFVRRWARFAAVVAAVISYTVLVGNQPPVLRAALMVCIVVAAKLLDRDCPALNTIAMAAFLLLVVDPTALEDPSFQMTFAAAAAVAGIGIPATRWLLKNLQEKLRDFDNAEIDGFLAPEVADWRVARRMFCEKHGLPLVDRNFSLVDVSHRCRSVDHQPRGGDRLHRVHGRVVPPVVADLTSPERSSRTDRSSRHTAGIAVDCRTGGVGDAGRLESRTAPRGSFEVVALRADVPLCDVARALRADRALGRVRAQRGDPDFRVAPQEPMDLWWRTRRHAWRCRSGLPLETSHLLHRPQRP